MCLDVRREADAQRAHYRSVTGSSTSSHRIRYSDMGPPQCSTAPRAE
jgi:hypothetical protein